MDEKLLNDNTRDAPEEVEDLSEEQTGFEIMEETFGTGARQKVLLVTRGISLKNLVKASK